MFSVVIEFLLFLVVFILTIGIVTFKALKKKYKDDKVSIGFILFAKLTGWCIWTYVCLYIMFWSLLFGFPTPDDEIKMLFPIEYQITECLLIGIPILYFVSWLIYIWWHMRDKKQKD